MRRKCFVLMPFAEERKEVYDHAIHPAASAAEFDCFRADYADAPRAIISDIIESILTADAIIADLSGSNPNVFYELGVAHTIANKTIMICDRAQEKLPFDLASYRVIFYRKTIDGIEVELRGRIEKSLREIHKWSLHTTNPVQDFRPIRYAVPLSEHARLEQVIERLTEELRILREEKRRGELRAFIMSLRDIEFRHLRNLAADGPFYYEKRAVFLEELRKLRTLGLIRNKPGAKIGEIPQTGDLKQYLELTELTREVLDELSRWVSQI